MTLRISEIVKLGHASEAAARPVTGVAPPAVSSPRVAACLNPAHPTHTPDSVSDAGGGADPQTPQALYAELVRECQRCVDEVEDAQRFTLGTLPALTERLVHHLLLHDTELLRLSTMGDHEFSLARHGVNVAILAVRVGSLEGGLETPALRQLGLAALLHDLGMVNVKSLIHSPARLNPEQLAQVREHPFVSARLVEQCPDLPAEIRTIIFQEHERKDSSGYPHRLNGRDIHEYAQLLGLLDLYEALTHDRPYRLARSIAEALDELRRDRARHFDPELVALFLHEAEADHPSEQVWPNLGLDPAPVGVASSSVGTAARAAG